MDRFAARAATLGQLSDRRAHVTAGLRLGALLPILGGASESFAMRYREEYLLAGGEYYARGYSPVLEMYGSAHNVFAQTFAGKGAAGLVALVLVVLTAAWSAWRALRDRDGPPHRRVLAAIALGMVGAFALYGQVQEVFYIPALQLTVCAAWGLAASLAPPAGAHPRARAGAIAWLLAAVLGAHLVQAYVVPGRLAEGYRDRAMSEAGMRLSAPVLGEDGEYFQWTGATAALTVPRQATTLSFELQSLAPVPQVVEVRFDDRVIDRIVLETHDWRRVVYPLSRMQTLPRRLELSASPAWQPPGEPRDLGVRVRRIRWDGSR
jgi:O-antigen ligase